MAANLILTAETEQDVAEAYAWYEGQRVGLGEEWLSCVDACIQTACRMPQMHPLVYVNYRRALVRRFPYAVFYEYANETVTVYAVFHMSRDPERWRQRVR